MPAEANYRQKAMEMPAKSEADGQVVQMEEAVDCSQVNKEIKEVIFMKDVQSTEMQGGYVMCEFGGEQQPVRVTASPGLQELGQEEIEELSFVPSAVGQPQWALHMCDNQCREEGFNFFHLVAIATKEGGTAQFTQSSCANSATM